MLDLNSDIRWLQRKVEVSAEDAAIPQHPESPSKLIFNGLFHPEVDRTLVGILALQQILRGDFAAFTGPQRGLPEPVRLKESSFNEMRALFFKVLGTDPGYVFEHGIPVGIGALDFIDAEKLDALVTHMVIHDLGKSKSFGVLAKAVSVEPAVDHDDILVKGVLGEDMLSHSFARLSGAWKGRILRGMSSAVNIPQFVQLENLPFNMAGLRDMSRDDFEFYYLHAFLDVAGSTALKDPHGSLVMNEIVYQGYKLAFEKMLEHYDAGVSPAQVYENFIAAKAKLLEIEMKWSEDRAVVRLAVLNRCGNAKCAALVKTVLASLPISFQELLVRELNLEGFEGWGLLPYYAPALFVNAKAGMKEAGGTDEEALRLALMTLARAYLAARIHLRKVPGDGVFTIGMLEISRLAKTDARALAASDFSFENMTPLGADLIPKPFVPFGADALPAQHSLKNLPGNNFVVIGIGSGSDSVQARILERLLRLAGKETLGTVAVHPQRSESGSPTSPVRTLENHLGLVGQDSYRVGETTTATQMDRFLEPLLFSPSLGSETPVFVTWERREPGRLADELKTLLRQLADERGIKVEDLHILAVDTGGDCLETAGGLDLAVASPDQDIRVLRALGEAVKNLGSRFTTAVVAPGIDGPRNFIEPLRQAGATFHAFDDVETPLIQATYKEIELDGSNPKRFGKTPFALQRALLKQYGVQVLPLPTGLIMSFKNPWNPAVFVEPGMAGVLFIEGGAHLKLLASPK